MINLIQLFQYLYNKGYYYFSGNNYAETLVIISTTGSNGRGDTIEVTIDKTKNNISLYYFIRPAIEPVNINSISEEKLFEFIQNL